MKSEIVEKVFVEFMLNVIGPSEKRENERNSQYLLIKKILDETISAQFPEIIPHIFLYGSFPIKTYLRDADLDISIILENKNNHQILIDIPQEVLNNFLMVIRDSFENYNRLIQQTLFTDINIIYADVKLIKCQINSTSLDISINNFFGLFKIVFMNNIFNQLDKKLKDSNENKLIIFKKTLILIKSWCFYEGNLMGSNIGLMASSALELLILYMFNFHDKEIHNEIDGFFCFFDLMNNIDFEKNIITIFGLIPIEKFHQKLFDHQRNKTDSLNKSFWYIDKENKNNNKEQEQEYLFDFNKLENIANKISNSQINLYFNINKNDQLYKRFFQEKLLNIIDPINCMNNLGKSINYHSYSKMIKAFEYMVKEIRIIKEIKQLEDPFLYINSLLRLFNVTLSMNFIELFINYLNMPKITIDSHLNENK